MGVDVANNRKDYDRIFNDVPLGKRKRYDGGPLGLGIPEDRTLIPVEKNAIIPAVMREIILREFCANQEKNFSACTKQNRFTSYFSCNDSKCKLNDCISKYKNVAGLEQQAIEEYLYERAQYRLTGLTKSYRENKNLVPPERKMLCFDIPSFDEMNAREKKGQYDDTAWNILKSKIRLIFGFKNT